MLNLDNYYLHATGGFEGTKNHENRIIEILRNEKIISSRENRNYPCSPVNKICLIDTRKLKNYPEFYKESAFREFALFGPTIALNRDIPVRGCKGIHKDEVRYKGEILLQKIEFITFPLYWSKIDPLEFDLEYKIKQLEIFKSNIEIIQNEFKTIPIKELYTGNDLKQEDIDKRIQLYRK